MKSFMAPGPVKAHTEKRRKVIFFKKSPCMVCCRTPFSPYFLSLKIEKKNTEFFECVLLKWRQSLVPTYTRLSFGCTQLRSWNYKTHQLVLQSFSFNPTHSRPSTMPQMSIRTLGNRIWRLFLTAGSSPQYESDTSRSSKLEYPTPGLYVRA